MAKGAYIGTGGTAKKIKKIYLGVGGVAKKVKKAYIGIGGVAKIWFSSDVVLANTVAATGITNPVSTSSGPTTTARDRGTVFNGYAFLDDGGTSSTDCKAAIYNSSLTKGTSITLPSQNCIKYMGRLPSYAINFGGTTATPYNARMCRFNTSLTVSQIYSGNPVNSGEYNEFMLSETDNYVICFGGSTYDDDVGGWNCDGVNWSINNSLTINKTSLAVGDTSNTGSYTTACSFGDKAIWLNAYNSTKSKLVVFNDDNSISATILGSTIMGGTTSGRITLNRVGNFIVAIGRPITSSAIVRKASIDKSLTYSNDILVPERTYAQWSGIAGVSTPDAVVFAGGGTYTGSSSAAVTSAFGYDEYLTLIEAPDLSRKATDMQSSVWPIGKYGIFAGGVYSSGAADSSGMSNKVEAYYEL